jgi:hypothetical protein
MMKFMRVALGLCIGVSVVTFGAASANAIVIDSFDTVTSFEQNSVGSSSASVNGSGILGGQREATINLISASFPGATTSALDIGGGVLTYNNDIAVSSQLNLLYDGIDGNSGVNDFGLGGIDLTDGGLSSGITVSYVSDADTSLIFRAFDSASNFSDYTLNLIGDNALKNAVVDYAGFVVAGGTGANLTNINAFEIILNNGGSVSSLDFAVNGIGAPTTVDESALGLPLIAGFLGFAVYARRKNKK